MTALMLQTLVLLASAYFIGAALACTLKRMLGANAAPAERRAVPAAPPPRPQGQATAAPSAAAAPAQPRVDASRDAFRRADGNVAAPAPAQASAAQAPVAQPAPANGGSPTRFERALAGEPAAQPGAPAPQAAAPQPAARPAPQPAAQTAPQPAPQAVQPAVVVQRPAPQPAPRPQPQPAPQPAAPPAGPSAGASAAAAASAASAALAAQAAVRATQRPAAPPPAPAQPAPAPVAAAPAPRAAAPAPVAVAPAPVAAAPQAPRPVAPAPAPTQPDDLALIRALDGDLIARLARLGVTRYEQIAAWTPSDVTRISDALGFRGRIEQENWIEQAQILSRGGETFYSRRRQRGEAATAQTVADEGDRPAPRQQAAAPAPAAGPASQQRSAVEAAAAAAAALAAAAARPQAAAVQPQPAPAPAQAPPPAPAQPQAAPNVANRAAFGAPPAAQQAPPVAQPAAQPPPAQPSAGQPSAGQAPVGVSRDALQRISGINGEVERLLNVQGISRYGQIASWGRNEVDRFDRLLGFPGRIGRENWIEQAQILARGGETAFSREFDRRGSAPVAPAPAPAPAAAQPAQAAAPASVAAAQPAAAVPAAVAAAAGAAQQAAAHAAGAARPSQLADAIRANTGESAHGAAPQVARPDLAGLRSVRSEALRAGEAVAVSDPARVVRSGTPDDLKRIRGVGVLIEKKLNSMGILTYEQIANWSTDDIGRVSSALDFRGRIERENWVEQARILASGGQTEFSRRVDRGEVETSRNR